MFSAAAKRQASDHWQANRHPIAVPMLKPLKPLRVVSHIWNIGLDWEPDETHDVNNLVVRLRTIR